MAATSLRRFEVDIDVIRKTKITVDAKDEEDGRHQIENYLKEKIERGYTHPGLAEFGKPRVKVARIVDSGLGDGSALIGGAWQVEARLRFNATSVFKTSYTHEGTREQAVLHNEETFGLVANKLRELADLVVEKKTAHVTNDAGDLAITIGQPEVIESKVVQ